MVSSESPTNHLLWRRVLVLILALVAGLAILWPGPESRQPPVVTARPLNPAHPESATLLGAPLRTHRSSGLGGAGPEWESWTVRGVVSARESGEPVAGALVFYAGSSEAEVSAERVARTDHDGLFECEVTSLVPVRILVLANRYLPWRSALIEHVPEGALQVELAQGGCIRGIVVDEKGRPVSGVRVWATLERNQVSWPNTLTSFLVDPFTSGAEAVSAVDGAFILEGLEEATPYDIRAAMRGWTTFGSWLPPPAVVGGADVRLTVRPLARIAVVVRDQETGLPVQTSSTWFVNPTHCLSPPIQRRLDDLYGWSRADSPPDGMAHQRLEYVRNDPGEQTRGDAPSLEIHAEALGYVSRTVQVTLRFGESSIVEVPLVRERGAPMVAILPEVSFRGGETYCGPLWFEIKALGRGVSYSRVWFESGRATEVIRLPEGEYYIRPSGAVDAGIWWSPAGPRVQMSVVDGPGENATRFQLSGNPVLLAVVDERGREIRGYDLSVYPAGGVRGRSGPVERRWDFPSPADWNVKPVVWVRDGRWIVWANAAGIGAGEVEVNAPGDGSSMDARIVLLRDEELDPRVQEEAARHAQR